MSNPFTSDKVRRLAGYALMAGLGAALTAVAQHTDLLGPTYGPIIGGAAGALAKAIAEYLQRQ